MSLKVVHFIFILFSLALSAYFGGWCLQNYDWDSDRLMVLLGYCSLSACGGLIFYLIYFLKKTKGFGLLSWLVLFGSILGISNDALACAVCQFGTPDSPLVRAIRDGIWILLALVAFMLLGFLALFTFWAKRDRQASKAPHG